MNREVCLLVCRLALVTMALLTPVSILAQQVDGVGDRASGKTSTGSRQEAGGSELEELKARVDMLLELVEKQQRALASMEKRLAEVEHVSSAPATADAGGAAASPSGVTHNRLNDGVRNSAANSSQGQESKEEHRPVAGWNGSHAFLRSADGTFETNIIGFAQFDYRGYSDGDHPPNTMLIRRARIGVEGRLARYYEFKIESDFADTSSTLLRDFYLNIHRTDEFQLRFGHFKEPFSQEELRPDPAQDFVERSLANNLAPSRSPGLMALGTIDKGTMEYQVGIFNAKGLLATNNNGTPEAVLRLRFNPFRRSGGFWTKGLIFGGAVARGRTRNGLGVNGVTESRSFVFYKPETVNGRVTRANGELTWLLGPAALRAEYDQVNHEREGLGSDGANLPGEVAKAFSAQFTYLISGESKGDVSPVQPKRDLFSTEGGHFGLGAWELKARFARLQISDGTAKANHAADFYFGANWYMNRFVRYFLDFGVERFNDPLRSPNPFDRNYFVMLNRIQVVF